MDQPLRLAWIAKLLRCRLRDQTAARSDGERDDPVASSPGSPTIFEKLNSWRTQARIVENEREPRSSQELNMKSDELRDLAFQQTR